MNALRYAEQYSPVKVGNDWKVKTPVGVITRRSKKAAVEAADVCRKIDNIA